MVIEEAQRKIHEQNVLESYEQIDARLHVLCQILARVNRTYVHAQADDSHTNLGFDPISHRIYSRLLTSSQGEYFVAIDLNVLQLQLLNSHFSPVEALEVVGCTDQELQDALRRQLLAVGFEADFRTKMHYDIPNYNLSGVLLQEVSADMMHTWTYFRTLANTGCDLLNQFLQTNVECRIWPHHFDTGIYALPSEDVGLGFGLAMKDDLLGEPYFYLAGYKSEEKVDYNTAAELSEGKWQIGDHWSGAVLPMSTIAYQDLTAAIHKLKTFINDAASWYLRS